MAVAWREEAWRRQRRSRNHPEPNRPDLREPFGAWLDGFPWSWFVTLTFPAVIGPEQAGRAWSRWVRLLEDDARHALRWARALEYQKRGVIHFHALLWPLAREVQYATARARWSEAGGGFSWIQPYEHHRGAAHYLGKYIVKGGEVDYGGKWWNPRHAEGGA